MGFLQKGQWVNFFLKESLEDIMKKTGAKVGDSIFMACSKKKDLERITSLARDKNCKRIKFNR